jgi:hypothetical protein
MSYISDEKQAKKGPEFPRATMWRRIRVLARLTRASTFCICAHNLSIYLSVIEICIGYPSASRVILDQESEEDNA